MIKKKGPFARNVYSFRDTENRKIVIGLTKKKRCFDLNVDSFRNIVKKHFFYRDHNKALLLEKLLVFEICRKIYFFLMITGNVDSFRDMAKKTIFS